MAKPLVIELFAGKFGWGEQFAAEGWRVIGFDIEHLPHHGPVPPGCELVLQDVSTLHGGQFMHADAIVASPPCQGYSARAMPWSRLRDEMLLQHQGWEDDGGPPFDKPLSNPPIDNTLYRATLRIHREACEATRKKCTAGHRGTGWDLDRCTTCHGRGYTERYIPLLIENVKGAQRWIGGARWHYGSFYLWGDVPALMPHAKAFKTVRHANKRDGHSHTRRLTNQAESEGIKALGQKNGEESAMTRLAEDGVKRKGRKIQQGFNNWPKDDTGAYVMPDGSRAVDGIKQEGSGAEWFDAGLCKVSSRSNARKAASAQIAKIPEPLARHIARVFKP